MTLNEVQRRPIVEVVAEMNLVETKIHTDDGGTIRSIEMKYVPVSENPDGKIRLEHRSSFS